MTDYFGLLDQPRCPWLDLQDLQRRFLALSSVCHPDRCHGFSPAERKVAQERFTALNAAFHGLKNPKARVLHLLELETGATPESVQEIPSDATELFLEVNGLCRAVDRFLKERGGVGSPLLRVTLFERSQEWLDRLRALRERLLVWREQLHDALRQINPAWLEAPPPGSPDRVRALPLDRLEQLYRLLSYEERWLSQVEERLFQLAA